MEILTGILAFLHIIELLCKLPKQIIPEDKRIAAGDLLITIGNQLNAIADDLAAHQYPHARCAEMFQYLTKLDSILSPYMSEYEVNRLINLVNECYRVEQLYAQLEQLAPVVHAQNISMLRTAAGTFIATGNLIKII